VLVEMVTPWPVKLVWRAPIHSRIAGSGREGGFAGLVRTEQVGTVSITPYRYPSRGRAKYMPMMAGSSRLVISSSLGS
jgi:hypothetical protein